MAILAGDALLTLRLPARRRANAARGGRARGGGARSSSRSRDAAGTDGMVGGQVVDIESEGKAISRRDARLHPPAQDRGAHPCLAPGGGAAGPADRRRTRWTAISRDGQSLGLAFQIVDDILDVEGNLAELGKSAGSDERKQKATYPALHGLPTSKRTGPGAHRRRPSACCEPLGPAADPIRALADYVLERRS